MAASLKIDAQEKRRAKMLPLKVPLFLQPADSPYCGPACMKMVLAYHGRNMSLQKIANNLPMRTTGIDMASMGTFFLKEGFGARIIMWSLAFPSRFLGLAKEAEIRREILAWCKRRSMMTRRGRYDNGEYRKTLPVFIENGGEVISKPVSLEDLKESLRRNCPSILNLNVAMLYKLPRIKYAGHYIVPISINDKWITVNDPSRLWGGVKKYPLEFVLAGCYIWNAGALFITP